MDPKLIAPIAITLLVMWSIYRRVRRSIGRQPVSPARMRWRIGILSVVAAILAATALRDLSLLGALLGGIAGGGVLAWFGLQHTKFEVTPEGRFYTPHTMIGAFVSVLFVGRIVYRLIAVNPMAHAATRVGESPFATYQSPLTLAIFGVVVGYYVAYYVGVLAKSQALPVAQTAQP